MKVGILGGGQLSRMLLLAGAPLGLTFMFYDPQDSEPVRGLGQSMHGDYSDFDRLKSFLDEVDVVTYENENIPVATCEFIATHKPLHPGVNALKIMQDRLHEKQYFTKLAIPTTAYCEVNTKEDLRKAISTLGQPVVLKKRRFGYDGKGQIIVQSADDIEQLSEQDVQQCIAEEFMPFEREVSIIAVRSTKGETAFYDLCENEHKDGILRNTYNRLNDEQQESAQDYINRILDDLGYVGVCTLEFFQVKQQLYANELAPRVHNSGHWTIEGAYTSQFENHLRAICGWPLGDVGSRCQIHMKNIISSMPDRQDIIAKKAWHLHDYQKQAAPGRKLGHITITKP